MFFIWFHDVDDLGIHSSLCSKTFVGRVPSIESNFALPFYFQSSRWRWWRRPLAKCCPVESICKLPPWNWKPTNTAATFDGWKKKEKAEEKKKTKERWTRYYYDLAKWKWFRRLSPSLPLLLCKRCSLSLTYYLSFIVEKQSLHKLTTAPAAIIHRDPIPNLFT